MIIIDHLLYYYTPVIRKISNENIILELDYTLKKFNLTQLFLFLGYTHRAVIQQFPWRLQFIYFFTLCNSQ